MVLEVKVSLQNLQKMVRLTPGRELLVVLDDAQLCGVVVDLLLARGRALQQSALNIIYSEILENEEEPVEDLPDTVIVSLLIVNQ